MASAQYIYYWHHFRARRTSSEPFLAHPGTRTSYLGRVLEYQVGIATGIPMVTCTGTCTCTGIAIAIYSRSSLPFRPLAGDSMQYCKLFVEGAKLPPSLVPRLVRIHFFSHN